MVGTEWTVPSTFPAMGGAHCYDVARFQRLDGW